MKNLIKTVLKKEGAAQIAGSILLILVFVLPIVSLAGTTKIHVDAGASGKEDGSNSHPYKNLREALKHADKGDEIHIKSGKYKGNIEVPEKVKIFGEDRDKVVIEADDNGYETVDLNHGSELNKVTVKGGNYGVRVGKNDRASIVNCVIKDSRKHGVLIEEGKSDDKYKVSISKSLIENNGRKGIYSAQRRLVLIDNIITGNGNDGAEIEAFSRAWLEGNKFKDNKGSGLKMTLDGAYIWIKGDSFTKNKREGIEVNAYGQAGTIDIRKSKIANNDRWGIARVQRKNFPAAVWNGLNVQENTELFANEFGNISHLFLIIK